jgi:hypothetical protein
MIYSSCGVLVGWLFQKLSLKYFSIGAHFMKALPKIILIVIVFLVTLICAGASLTFAGTALEPEERIKILDAPELESWLDYAADGFESGTGSEDDPFLIATAEQLAYLAKTTGPRNSYEGKYIILINDIELGGNAWEPVGRDYVYPPEYLYVTSPFLGVFDGKGHAVSNMTISNFYNNGGLFGVVGTKMTNVNPCVKNLELKNIIIFGGFVCGGIVGLLAGAEVSNCYVNGTIKGYQAVGGIAGTVISANIKNCEVSADIGNNVDTSEFSDFSIRLYLGDYILCCGGIAGRFEGKEIVDCRAKVNLRNINYSGIVGLPMYVPAGEIKNSVASGWVKGEPFFQLY